MILSRYRLPPSVPSPEFARPAVRAALLFLPLLAALLLAPVPPAAQTDPNAPQMTPVTEPEAASFQAWLRDLAAEAEAMGVRRQTLDGALAGIEPIPRVLELDRRQPEFTMTLERYLGNAISDARVAEGRRLLAQHRDEIERISARFGVQPRFLVALWGLESSYGRNTGNFAVIPSLATLAYDGRRSAFFRRQLLDALVILDQQDMQVGQMIGSWAGAMGQVQFMPSTFRAYAVDGNGDGGIDIWRNRADALASAANYLSSIGWNPGQTWGRKVRLPAGFDAAQAEERVVRNLDEWQRQGIRRDDGGDLPAVDMPARVLLPAGPTGPAWLVYPNFERILNWNRSNFFGIAVGILSDRIGG